MKFYLISPDPEVNSSMCTVLGWLEPHAQISMVSKVKHVHQVQQSHDGCHLMCLNVENRSVNNITSDITALRVDYPLAPIVVLADQHEPGLAQLFHHDHATLFLDRKASPQAFVEALRHLIDDQKQYVQH